MHQSQLVSPSSLCSTVSSALLQGSDIYFSFSFLFYFVVCCDNKVHYSAGSLFFCCLSLGLIIWPRLGDPFVSQNPREVYESHSSGRILGSDYTICLCGQIHYHHCYYYYYYYESLTLALANGLSLESE